MSIESDDNPSSNGLAISENGSDVRNFPIAPFADHVKGVLKTQEVTDKITSIGVIIYADGQEAVFVGDDDLSKIKTKFVQMEGLPNPSEFSGSFGRVFNLSQFDEIAVATIAANGVRVKTEDSVRNGKTIKARLSYEREGSEKDEMTYVPEAELIDLFTGKKGGFLIFDGGNLPEETALVIEKEIDSKNAGIVFFFHSEDASTLGINSATGMAAFLNSLNNEWQRSITDYQDVDYLRRLSSSEQTGNSSLADEILRSMIIAHLRSARILGDQSALDYIRNIFPKRHFPKRDRVDVLVAIDKVFIKDKPKAEDKHSRKVMSADASEVAMLETLGKLHTWDVKHLRETYQPTFGENTMATTTYLKKLFDWVGNGDLSFTNELYLKDSIVLLKELMESEFARQWVFVDFVPLGNSYYFDIAYDDGERRLSRDAKHVYLQNFLNVILEIANDRRLKLENRIRD